MSGGGRNTSWTWTRSRAIWRAWSWNTRGRAMSENAVQSPQKLRERVLVLNRDRQRDREELADVEARLAKARAFLELAPKVEAALDELGKRIFDDLIRMLQEKLTIALQEVL